MNTNTKQRKRTPVLADYYLDSALLVVEAWNYKEGCILRPRVRLNDPRLLPHPYSEHQLIGINVIKHDDERIEIKHLDLDARGFKSKWRSVRARLLIEEMTDFRKFAAYVAP